MNQLDILKSGIVGAKIVSMEKDGLGYRMTLCNTNVVLLTPILDRGVDKIQAVIKVGLV